MLKDYVRNTVDRIISSREQRGEMPAVCTLDELMKEAREDILECMRDLHRERLYRASKTINQIPMLIRRENETN